jgi:hypothetical protein
MTTEDGSRAFRVNTALSYLVRSLIFAQLACFWLMSKATRLNMSSVEKLARASQVLSVIIAVLLVLDWATRKDPSRRFSKLIDTVLGIVWLLVVGAIIIYSLSMGTL